MRCAAACCRWSYPGGFNEARKSERARGTAQWLRGAILQLGPTFIKLGQLFRSATGIVLCMVTTLRMVKFATTAHRNTHACMSARVVTTVCLASSLAGLTYAIACSTRSDLFPREFVEELAQLQARPARSPDHKCPLLRVQHHCHASVLETYIPLQPETGGRRCSTSAFCQGAAGP